MEEGSGDRNNGGRFVPSWRSGGGGRGSSGTRSNSGRSRSDAPSSRKSLGVLAIDGEASKKREEVEVTGPLKIQHHNATENVSKHVLFASDDGDGKGGETIKGGDSEKRAEEPVVEDAEVHVNRTQQAMHVDGKSVIQEVENLEGSGKVGAEGSRSGTFKRLPRSSEPKGTVDRPALTERKRQLSSDDEVEVEGKSRELFHKTLVRDCRNSPARANEDNCVELPGIGERPGNS